MDTMLTAFSTASYTIQKQHTGVIMAKKNEQTSKKVASKAGKLLAKKKTPKAVKSVAGSALS